LMLSESNRRSKPGKRGISTHVYPGNGSMNDAIESALQPCPYARAGGAIFIKIDAAGTAIPIPA
jgi:hypothetical protein